MKVESKDTFDEDYTFPYHHIMNLDSLRSYFYFDLNKIKRSKLTYLSRGALYNIQRCVKEVESARIPGQLIETGCALGGSTILIGKAKKKNRILKVYDVFGMIPPPSAEDGQDVHDRYAVIESGSSKGINGDAYYGYEENLINKVKDNLKAFGLDGGHNIQLVQGLYENTLKVSEPVALAHIDCDWYASVMTCLEQITPQLSPGGIMIIDDYHHYSGCKTAVDEYFSETRSQYDFHSRNEKLIIRNNR